jgi:MFS family permease
MTDSVPSGPRDAAHDRASDALLIDSPKAARRLAASFAAATLGSAPMYVLPVALPAVQPDFGVGRGETAFAYMLLMAGLGAGGYLCGRWSDRLGVARVLVLGGMGTLAGYLLSAAAPSLAVFALAHCLLLGFLGMGSTFGPLMADTTLWWQKRRGVAVAIVASGNFLAGVIWPPIVQAGIEAFGWRTALGTLGIFCGLGMMVLSLGVRLRPPSLEASMSPGEALASRGQPASERPFGMSPNAAQWLLFVAAVGCCVAMAMPQVHIVAYCADLGFGAARGAEMLSLMLGFGVVSRLASGWISDQIGGMRTLLLGAALQAVALALFLPFDSLGSLYVISALFGFFQGGIFPAYAIIVREHFPPDQAAARTGAVLVGGQVGMALGGWASGKLFDVFGTYDAAFIHGLAWNALNLAIVVYLLWRIRPRRRLIRGKPSLNASGAVIG